MHDVYPFRVRLALHSTVQCPVPAPCVPTKRAEVVVTMEFEANAKEIKPKKPAVVLTNLASRYCAQALLAHFYTCRRQISFRLQSEWVKFIQPGKYEHLL